MFMDFFVMEAIILKTFFYAIKKIIPILFSYVFVGIAFGVLMHEAGYSSFFAFLSSIFIYAGSMQIIMISLMKSGMPIYMIGVLTFFINARHIFYGIKFIERFKKMGYKYPYMALTLTDETYSVLCSVKYPDDIDGLKADFYIAFICHLLWILSCTLGALFGQLIPFNLKGIEFSAVAFFVTVCVNQWKQFESHIPAITGFISSIIFYFILGPNNFILPALSLSLVVLVIMKDKILLKMGDLNYD